jgi:hypothetical protein
MPRAHQISIRKLTISECQMISGIAVGYVYQIAGVRALDEENSKPLRADAAE